MTLVSAARSVAGLVRTLVALVLAHRVVVRGWSMAPHLLPGERMLVDRLAYRRKAPIRGDLVLVRHPQERSRLLLKRVAALSGERARLTREGLLVNENDLYPLEPSVSERSPTGTAWHLGQLDYLVVGDAPDLSTDSRHFGPVHRRDILGKAWLVYWPPGRRRRVR